METNNGKEREEEGGKEYGRRKLRGSAQQRDITEPRRPTLLARRIARLPRRIPAPTILLRAKWLIIIIIILYFLRSSETTEKQKAHEININKSSGHRTYRRTDERYPKMERVNGWRKEAVGRERRKTHTYRKRWTKGERKEDGGKGEEGRTDAKVVGCIVATLGI